jgi:hypothetical protein
VHPAEAQHDAALELGDDPNARPEQEQNHGPDRDQYEHRVHIVLRLMPGRCSSMAVDLGVLGVIGDYRGG